MIGCQGTHGKTFACENHEAHSVGWPAIDEFGSNLFGSFHTAGSEILSQHTPTDIQTENNINPFTGRQLLFAARLWPGKGNDDAAKGKHPENKNNVTQKCFPCVAFTESLYAGHQHTAL